MHKLEDRIRGSKVPPLPGFSPELQFVFAAARLDGRETGMMAQFHRASAQVADWDIAAQGLARHGLIGITAPAMVGSEAVPAATRAALDIERGAHIVNVMTRLRELIRIARALDDAGIRHLFIKGIALSMQLHGDPIARGGRDIDVLIERSRRGDAEAILRNMGYRLPINAPARSDSIYAEPPKESAWVHDETRVLVELHDRLCENHALLPWDFDDLWAERETATIAGKAVPTMARRRLPVYLAVHGIRHGWQRLLWLTDLAALLDRPTAWDDARADAQALGMEGMMLHVGWALHHWIARPVPADVLDIGARRIDVRILNFLVARFHDGPGWHHATPRNALHRLIEGSIWSRSITYVMKPTRHFWGRQLAWDIRSPQDRAAFALPSGASWMYPLIRPFGWAIRRLRR